MADPNAEVTVRRAYQVYLYAVCFVTVLVLLFASAQAIFGIVRIAAPGTTSGTRAGPAIFEPGPGREAFTFDPEEAERDRGVRELLQSGLLAIIAGVVFGIHWQLSVRLRRELEEATAPPRATADAGGAPG